MTASGALVPAAVAWEFSVAQVSGKGTFQRGAPEPALFLYGEEPLFQIHFAEQLDQYCVTLTARNLRDGAELSEEYCASPDEPLDHKSEDSIRACSAPPGGEFTARWCALRPDSDHPACGSTNPEPDAGAPSTVPALPATPMTQSDDDAGAGDAGCACSTQLASQGASASSMVLALLALLLVRRRRGVK